MPDINIDTSSPQYQNLLAGIGTLRTMLAPRFKVFIKLPRPKQIVWLQRDPLFRAVTQLVRDVNKLNVLTEAD